MSDDVERSREEEYEWARRISYDLSDKLEETIKTYDEKCTAYSGVVGIIWFASCALRAHCAILDGDPEFLEHVISAFTTAMRMPEDEHMREIRLLIRQARDE